MRRLLPLRLTTLHLTYFVLFVTLGVPVVAWMAAHELVRDVWDTTWMFVRRAWRTT